MTTNIICQRKVKVGKTTNVSNNKNVQLFKSRNLNNKNKFPIFYHIKSYICIKVNSKFLYYFYNFKEVIL